MGEIIPFPITPKINYTNGKVPVSQVLLSADQADLKETVVIGFKKDEKADQFYFASSEADGGTVLWLLEMAKKRLLEYGEQEINEDPEQD